MTEEFGVDGSFRNGTAVEGEVSFSLAWARIVDDARNDFLTHTIFTLNEDRQIHACHFEGCLYGTIERIAVANDAVALFDGL